MWERNGCDVIRQLYTYGNYSDEVLALDDRRAGLTEGDLNDATGNDRYF